MIEGVSHEIGVQRAREKQAQGIADPVEWQQTLLKCAEMRDALRMHAENGNLEEALANHLDGFLSAWD